MAAFADGLSAVLDSAEILLPLARRGSAAHINNEL
jgi:hypothetical protein